MATVIENLITTLSFNADIEAIEAFDNAIDNVAKGLTAVVVGAAAATTAIFLFTKKIAGANDATFNFARTLGLDIQALQELGYVAEINGSSINSMNSSLSSLTKLISETARGVGSGVETFGLLGISVVKSNGQLKKADELLLDISDALTRLGDPAKQLEFAGQLGISEDLLLTLTQGSEALMKQRAEAEALNFTFGVEGAKAAADFNDEMIRINRIVVGVSNAIGTKLMQVINPMLRQFIEWFKINRELIQQNLAKFLTTLVDVLTTVFNVGKRVFNLVNNIVSVMGGWKPAIAAVTAAFITLNASVLLLPALIIALGAGILLLIEDLITYANEGDSALGVLANKSVILKAFLDSLLAVLKLIGQWWAFITTQDMKFLDGLLDKLKEISSFLDEFFIEKINKVVGLLNKIPGINIDTTQKIGQIIDYSANQTTGSEDFRGILTQRTNNQINNASNQVANTNNISININGGDTQKIKQVVTEVLQNQYSGAQENLSSQVEY